MDIKNKNDEKFDKFDMKNIASASECTGLIRQIPLNEDEFEAYHDIFDYGPEQVENENSDEVVD